MTTFMSPPPVPTYIAFHPKDNNIIAVGMDDSTVHIYSVRVDEVCMTFWLDDFWHLVKKKGSQFSCLCQVKGKLRGHSNQITGLAFSKLLDTLVSTGADAQVTFIFYGVHIMRKMDMALPSKSNFYLLVETLTLTDTVETGITKMKTSIIKCFLGYLIFRLLHGILRVGESIRTAFYKFQLVRRLQECQICRSSFIRIRYISLLCMRPS